VYLDKPDKPQVDGLGFDHRLMTPERLLTLAGAVPLIVKADGVGDDTESDMAAVVLHQECGGVVTVLEDEHWEPYPFTAQQLLQDVLRHLVTRHNVSLAGQHQAAPSSNEVQR
jgi:hypothetical protein